MTSNVHTISRQDKFDGWRALNGSSTSILWISSSRVSAGFDPVFFMWALTPCSLLRTAT